MTKLIALGATVLAGPLYDNPMFSGQNGKVIGQLKGGMYLVQFEGQYGHNGFDYVLERGSKPTVSRTGWYIVPEKLTVISEPMPVVTPAANADPVEAGAPEHTKDQRDVILNHLLAGNSISQLEAFGVFGIYRLAARIFDLKKKGHKIITTMKKDAKGKPYAEYHLVTRKLRAA